MKINFTELKKMYLMGCIFTLPVTTCMVFDSQPSLSYEEIKINRHKAIMHNIGYGTIGFIFGASYPISFPIAAIYTIVDISSDYKRDLPLKK